LTTEHLSFDIETLGIKPGSVIVSLGMTAFDPKAGVQSIEVLKNQSSRISLRLEDSLKRGFKIDASTMLWWLKQPDSSRNSTFISEMGYYDCDITCDRISEFVKRMGCKYVWGNGANFDVVLIEEMFDKCEKIIPWKFWDIRCLRTMKETLPYNKDIIPKNELKHDCLYDAIYQAQVLQAIAFANPTAKFS